jgi:hypothetical protein
LTATALSASVPLLRGTSALEVECHPGEGFTKRLKMEPNPRSLAHLLDKAGGALWRRLQNLDRAKPDEHTERCGIEVASVTLLKLRTEKLSWPHPLKALGDELLGSKFANLTVISNSSATLRGKAIARPTLIPAFPTLAKTLRTRSCRSGMPISSRASSKVVVPISTNRKMARASTCSCFSK